MCAPSGPCTGSRCCRGMGLVRGMSELTRWDRDAREVVDVVIEARAALLSARDGLFELEEGMATGVRVLADLEWAQRQPLLPGAEPRGWDEGGQRVQDLARSCEGAVASGRDAGRAVVRVRAALQAAGALVEEWSPGSTQERLDQVELRDSTRELITALNGIEGSLERTVDLLGRTASSAREAARAHVPEMVEALSGSWHRSLSGATVSFEETDAQLELIAAGTLGIGRHADGVAAAARARLDAARRAPQPTPARTPGVAR